MEHSVNVMQFAEARASEISYMMGQMKSSSVKKQKSWFQKLPHYMRRRGASLNPKRVPKRLREEKMITVDKIAAKKKQFKKKPKDMQQEYANRSTSENTWLETHIWHAKRFKMDTLWGYRLPIHSNDRKIGVSHKAAANGALALDLSYFNCIELQGVQERLLEKLSVLTDASSGHSFESKMFLDGNFEGHTFLFRPKTCPLQAIGPVTFLWRPTLDCGKNGCHTIWIWCHPSMHDELVQVFIQIFELRENPVNFAEVEFQCKLTKAKIGRHYKKEKVFVGVDVKMLLLKDALARHRLIGPKALQVLTLILKVSEVDSSAVNCDVSCSTALNNVLKNGESSTVEMKVEACAELSLKSEEMEKEGDVKSALKRPFVSESEHESETVKKLKIDDEVADNSTICSKKNKKRKNAVKQSSKLSETPIQDTEKDCSKKSSEQPELSTNLQTETDISSTIKQNLVLWWETYFSNETGLSNHNWKKDVWEVLKDRKSICWIPPRSVIGLTVRDPRLAFGRKNVAEDKSKEDGDLNLEEAFTPSLSDSPLWQKSIREEVAATKLSDHTINEVRAQCIVSPDFGKQETRVPVILVHKPDLNGFAAGWDIILPLGWSFEFWRCYEKQGCRPCGLRDLDFVNLEAGRPSFPVSFPDTIPGSEYEEKIRKDAVTRMYRRPKNQRDNFCKLGVPTPYFMCWKTLVDDWVKEVVNSNLFSGIDVSVKCDVETISDIDEDCKVTEIELSGDNIEAEKVEKNTHFRPSGFCVLRKNVLWDMKSFCEQLTRHSKRPDKLHVLQNSFHQIITNLSTVYYFTQSLILIKIKCPNKGAPSAHSNLYLPNEEDIANIKTDPKFQGSTEPVHLDEKKPISKSEQLKRPIVDSVISSSTRKTVGYLSQGGFSSFTGHGFGIGHCSLVGFLVMMKQCMENGLPPYLLWRKQHCYHYRLAHVEIIDSYL